jgi:hypothetical protein
LVEVPSKLKNEQTVEVDLGASATLTIRNLVEVPVLIYVDFDAGDHWTAITGERKLPAGGEFVRSRVELGHERVRVGVRGPDDGRDLVLVSP